MLSFIIPTYDKTNISYTKKAVDTGIDIIFIKCGLSIHKEIVTKAEAVIGTISYHSSNDNIPKLKLTVINNYGL